ncbi:MAG TPA: glycerol-3-phosphate acyltransferase, partial [Desulfobacterales bacterium]|nr:glycerol-3-phosphate acyltransferase [Desulfobacterales bacterium]
PWIGLSLILGNRFPCFHGFQGGKGVANYLGLQ